MSVLAAELVKTTVPVDARLLATLLAPVVVRQAVTRPVKVRVRVAAIPLAQGIVPVLATVLVVLPVLIPATMIVIQDAQVHVQAVAILLVLQLVLILVTLTIAGVLVLLHVLTIVPTVVKDNVKDVPLAPEGAEKVVLDAVQRARTNVQVVVVPAITHAPRLARQSAVRHATRPAHQPAWVWN